MASSSYPNWTGSSQVPVAQAGGGGTYPPTSLAADPYAKGPSAAQPYGSDPHEVSLQTSVPAVPLSVGSSQQPAARASYSYPQSTNAPPPSLPMPTSSEASLSVPRYVDDPRPSKSPRHGSHPSVHSTGSIINDGAPEYRYSSSYGSIGSHPTEGQPAAYGQDSSATLPPPPQRDFYGSSSTWTTTTGEIGSTAAYAGGERRAYPSPGQYKGGVAGKSDNNVIPPPGSGAVYTGPPRESIDTMNHYSWHAI